MQEIPPPEVIQRARNGKADKPVRFQQTELQMADALVSRFGDELRYCAPLGGWFLWTGTHWQRDHAERARECVKSLAKDWAHEAVAVLDADRFKEAKRAGSAAGVRAILELARSTPGIVFLPEEANRDPWSLNVQNGTIDLKTGALRPHDRSELITRCCPVAFEPRAKAPTFQTFLAEVQPNPDVRRYLARLLGYSASGAVREHVMAVLWGPGANGKSVLADVVTHALGDYAKPGPSSLVVLDGKHTPHPTDVASCVGARLVVVHETKRGASFDASKVKLLTGGDQLTARFMRQDFFAFEPTHTLVMLSNYKPKADATDAALWRRVQLVPFEVVIDKEDQDPELADRIKAHEAAGVLRWLVDGARQWQREGLAPPEAVVQQTAAYRAAEDAVGQFLEDACVRQGEAKVRSSHLFGAFKRWCADQGYASVHAKELKAELTGRGFTHEKRKDGNYFVGLGLHASEYEEG